MKKHFKTIIIFMMSLVMVLSFAGCGGSENEDTPASETVTEATQPPTESGSLTKVDIPTNNFYGTWVAKSGKAKYLYGSLEITLKEDGTWTGRITGEDLDGTWEEVDYGVHIYNEEMEWESELFYTSKDRFVLDEDGMRIVLTRQE